MQRPHAVIPRPAEVDELPGEFRLPRAPLVFGAEQVAAYLAEHLGGITGLAAHISGGAPGPGDIVLRLVSPGEGLGREGYALQIDPDGIQATADSAAGLFYAAQTLLQLLSGPPWAVPCARIRDYPRFPYRGMHLDVGRHFFPVEFIKRYLDLLALHKLNTFHWHLTEDQGWRIDIRRYPRLAEVAAFRAETLIGHYSDQPHRFDGQRYGGYYTQDEIRDVVAYASARQITIIPEIEMPGHSLAALAAYPELACRTGPFETAPIWGIHEDVYCAGNDAVFAFLEDVLDEVIALFPGTYIHIGGDECPKDRWRECPKCQARIRAEGLADEDALQSYFIRRIERHLLARGRRLVGWDEIMEGGLAPAATVMSWRGMDGGIAAARQGHAVIMTPTSHCYFDYYQAEPSGEPIAIGGLLPLEKVYEFEPQPLGLEPDERALILGAQGNVWTGYMPTPQKVEYMSVPRMSALAEAVWSPREQRDWLDFRNRFETLRTHLDRMEVNYRRPD